MMKILKRQLKYVIRSLKDDGVFEWLVIEDVELVKVVIERIQGETLETTGGVIRPLEDEIVEDCGGYLEWISDVCHCEGTIKK